MQAIARLALGCGCSRGGGIESSRLTCKQGHDLMLATASSMLGQRRVGGKARALHQLCSAGSLVSTLAIAIAFLSCSEIVIDRLTCRCGGGAKDSRGSNVSGWLGRACSVQPTHDSGAGPVSSIAEVPSAAAAGTSGGLVSAVAVGAAEGMDVAVAGFCRQGA